MKNRQIIDLVYALATGLSIALPALYFEVYSCNEPPETLVDLYVFGMVTEGVPVGGFALQAEDLERHFTRTLLHMTLFFQQVWKEERAPFYPSALAVMYELHEAGEKIWWQVA
jgi:hypothetical protein